MKINHRDCPTCGKKITYKSKRDYSYKLAIKNNSNCKECTASKIFLKMNKEIKEGKRVNGFHGKTHTKINKATISESLIKAYDDGRLDVSGRNNPMYGIKGENNSRTGTWFYEDWLKKYGKEEADKRLENYKKKQSILNSGKNNNMYGKPSPKGSGNGWSGWYKGWYFRSLRELSYMINVIERFGLKWSSTEGIMIPYIDWKGDKRNYFPDFLINEKYLVEIKPKKLFNSDSVIRKAEAAKKYCDKEGLIYKIIDPMIISKENLVYLHNKGKIEFLSKYKEKIYDYFN